MTKTIHFKNHPALAAFLTASAILILLCSASPPIWQTNDDAAMSMIAHGYGLAAYGSPNLVFSNVLWGYVVRAIPSINGVLGYSLATLATLLLFGWATMYFLLRLGVQYFLSLLTIALLLALPTLYPQFTVNAGLLTVAAIVGWQVYARWNEVGILIISCLLAFFGFLIRYEEFLLVLGVALPLLPWRTLQKQRTMQIVFLLLGVAITSAAVFDRWSYSGSEWQHFQKLHPQRSPLNNYLNFGAGTHLKQRPDILAPHGYSPNDIDLITNWFLVDPQIADAKALGEMLAELGPQPTRAGSIQSGWEAIKALFNPVWLPLLILALLLLAWMPRWSVAFVWVLCLIALFAMGVMGRPGVLRVYIPLVTMLLIAPLAVGKFKGEGRQWIVYLMLFGASVGSAYILVPSTLETQQWMQQVKKEIRSIKRGTSIVTWKDEFPFEVAFAVLSNDVKTREINFYGLDSFALAPFSVANNEQMAGRGMLKRLQEAAGVLIVASPQSIELLRVYCREHFKRGRLVQRATYQGHWITVQQVRCFTNE